MMNKLLLSLVAIAFTLFSAAYAKVEPASVSIKLRPGATHKVWKKITIPDVPTQVDICLVQDLSGSYRDDLPNLRAQAPAITDLMGSDAKFGLVGFKDYPISPFGGPKDYPFKLIQGLGSAEDFTSAIGGLTATGGGDKKESQYDAIVKSIGKGGCEFRPDPATRIIIAVSDAPCHTKGDKPRKGGLSPYLNDEASTIAALTSNDVVFIGLYTGNGAKKCFDPLAAATGGATVQLSSTSSNIASAIKAAIKKLTFDVKPMLLPSKTCQGVDFAFNPTEVKDLGVGDMAKFRESITLSKRVRDHKIRAIAGAAISESV